MSAISRQFIPCGSHADLTKAAIRMFTYNILAPKYAFGGMHDYCPPQFLELSYRGKRIRDEILGAAPDIMCLQEVERPFLEEELQPALLAQGFQALYYGRPVRPSDAIKGPEEGIALLYRTSRFRLMASTTVRFGDLVDASLQGRFWDKVRELGEGAIWALLHDHKLARPILVGCTHLYWDPRWPDVKVAQAHLLCHAARTLLCRAQLASPSTTHLTAFTPPEKSPPTPSPVPVLLGGDFNSLPEKLVSDAFDSVPPGHKLVSGVYQLLSQGTLDASHHDHPAARRQQEKQQLSLVHFHTSGLQLQSALAAAWGREPPFTNKTAAFQGCLDYLWASPEHWQAVHVLEMPYCWDAAFLAGQQGDQDVSNVAAEHSHNAASAPAADSFPAIPNAGFPSDHLALGAQLAWKR